MNSFYYSIELQTVIVYGQRILFVFSSLFNIIAFFCLLKQTPEHQSKFRNYLLLIQVLAAINDINFDILVEPFPLFPALGGFCKGLVCQWSVPIQYSFATTVLLIGLIGFSIAICILYRHQSIVRGKFKLSFVRLICSLSAKHLIPECNRRRSGFSPRYLFGSRIDQFLRFIRQE
ncbi:hypothetical protein PENTCL1PPCAC_17333 [Pristionchus entomophagus]|uniref:G protein-coupled receptor n=1 Tax=Pristionchus entomophagus TaxID=358040 RepID=A0AAV5TL72_9BILA|nr:hypothetical protein PENTCL1PPCAC_17333 [Pristionchus entomophagus]